MTAHGDGDGVSFGGLRMLWDQIEVVLAQHLNVINATELSTFMVNGEFFFNSFKFIYLLFIYFWLCWVFVSVRGLCLVAASGGHSSSRCAGLSLSWPLLLRSTGSRCAGSVVVAHGPRCSAACGIFPDQGSNLCLLHWQADSQPLRHQGSPNGEFYVTYILPQLKNKPSFITSTT